MLDFRAGRRYFSAYRFAEVRYEVSFQTVVLRGFLRDGRGGFGSSACVGVSVVGGACMRCEPILTAMDYVGRACAGGACADCTAVGYCVGLKKRCGFTIGELAKDFDNFFYGVRERNSPSKVGE